MMKERGIRLACLLLAMIMLLSACGEKPASSAEESILAEEAVPVSIPEEHAAPEPTQAPAAPNTLNLLLGENLERIDPGASTTDDEAQIYTQVFSGLLRIVTDETGHDTFMLDGAERYECSEDGLTYTFYLRDNHWSDGEPVTAQQYVDSFFRNLDEESGLPTQGFFDVVNAEDYYNGEADMEDVGVVALDEGTLEYTLEDPSDGFLYALASRIGYPLRTDVLEEAGDAYGKDPGSMVFNGPFVLSSWMPGDSMTLTKNDQYWDAEHVSLETVTLRTVSDSGTRDALFDAGQLDILPFQAGSGESWLERAEAGAVQYIEKPGAEVCFLTFAAENGGITGLMGSESIRKALSLSVDRKALADTLAGSCVPAYTFVPPVVQVGDSAFHTAESGRILEQQAEYSTDEALRELFQQGLRALDRDTAMDQINLDLLVRSGDDAALQEAEYLARNWQKRLGILVTVDVTSDAESRMSQLDFDLCINSWNGGASPYDYLCLAEDSYRLKYLTGAYSNEEVDELLETVTSISDEAERADCYHEIENMILDEAGVGPLYFPNIRYFTQSRVQGVSFTSFGPALDFSRASVTGGE